MCLFLLSNVNNSHIYICSVEVKLCRIKITWKHGTKTQTYEGGEKGHIACVQRAMAVGALTVPTSTTGPREQSLQETRTPEVLVHTGQRAHSGDCLQNPHLPSTVTGRGVIKRYGDCLKRESITVKDTWPGLPLTSNTLVPSSLSFSDASGSPLS